MFLYAQFFIFMTTLLVTTRSCLSHFHQRYWVSDARCKAVICAEVFLYIHPAMSRLWCCNARLEVWSVACQQSRLYLQHHLLHLPLWKSGQKKPVMWQWFDTFFVEVTIWYVACGRLLECLFYCALSALLCSKNQIERRVWFACVYGWKRGSADITHQQILIWKVPSATLSFVLSCIFLPMKTVMEHFCRGRLSGLHCGKTNRPTLSQPPALSPCYNESESGFQRNEWLLPAHCSSLTWPAARALI